MNILRRALSWLRQHRWLGALILAAVVISFFYLDRWRRASEGIVTEPLHRGPVVQAVYGIGTVVANRSFQAKGGITTHLDEAFVTEGDRVRKGDRLARIDETLIRAPFDGTITYFPYKIGELVFAQTIILSLVDLTDRYMTVSLEQQGALQVRPGQPVRISFDTIRNETYEGTVRAVYSNQNDFLARIDVRDLPPRILPGMTADVAITTQRKDDALLIPVAALDGEAVWVKRDHRPPRRVEVKIGFVDRDVAEVLEGDLNAGDRLIIRGKKSP